MLNNENAVYVKRRAKEEEGGGDGLGADETGGFKDRKQDPSSATNNKSPFGVHYLLEKLQRLQAAKDSRMECGKDFRQRLQKEIEENKLKNELR